MLFRTGDHSFHSQQLRRQRLTARMRAALPLISGDLDRIAFDGRPFTLGLHFRSTDPRLLLQHLQLQVRQLLAAGSIFLDASESQPLFQNQNS